MSARYACDKPGCEYIAEGVTERQAIDRMGRHWTANDHEEHVRAILDRKESS